MGWVQEVYGKDYFQLINMICRLYYRYWYTVPHAIFSHGDVIVWKLFRALLALCARNSPVTGEFPPQRPVTRSFHVFFDLRLNERLGKQSWGWWFETSSRSLWRHCNGFSYDRNIFYTKPRMCFQFIWLDCFVFYTIVTMRLPVPAEHVVTAFDITKLATYN